MLDPPLLSLVAPQPLRFLAKEELWRYRPGRLADGRARRDPGRARPRGPRRDRSAPRSSCARASRSRSSRRARSAAASGRAARPGSRSRRASRSCRCGSSARRGALARPHRLPADPRRRRRADPGRGRGRPTVAAARDAHARARGAGRRAPITDPYSVSDATWPLLSDLGARRTARRPGRPPRPSAPDRPPLPAVPAASRGRSRADRLLVRARRDPGVPDPARSSTWRCPTATSASSTCSSPG